VRLKREDPDLLVWVGIRCGSCVMVGSMEIGFAGSAWESDIGNVGNVGNADGYGR